jgi:hypothetical protein
MVALLGPGMGGQGFLVVPGVENCVIWDAMVIVLALHRASSWRPKGDARTIKHTSTPPPDPTLQLPQHPFEQEAPSLSQHISKRDTRSFVTVRIAALPK